MPNGNRRASCRATFGGKRAPQACCARASPRNSAACGGDFLHSTILVEEMARAGATGPTFYLHSEIVAPYLVRYGTEAQKRRWLPAMARGEAITALGMTEPSGGSDLQGMKTVALRESEHYVVNGQKVFITAGFNADLLVLACKTDPSRRREGREPVAGRDRHVRDSSADASWKRSAARRQDTAELFFSDMRVPVANLLGEEGRGFYQLMSELPQERLVQAIRAVASSEAALRMDARIRHAAQDVRSDADRFPEHPIQARRDEGRHPGPARFSRSLHRVASRPPTGRDRRRDARS